ncbi:MAG: hypothetical protein ACYDCO_03455 [Armatimonadota bacterium]
MLGFASMGVTRSFERKFGSLTVEEQQAIFQEMELVWEELCSEKTVATRDLPALHALDDLGTFYFRADKYYITFYFDETNRIITYAKIMTRKDLRRK